MGNSNQTAVAPSGRHQRKIKNLLLDKHFQLKYTGYLVAIAALVGAGLGLVLFLTSAEVISQGQRNARQGEQVVALGQEVIEESRKVSAVVRMNIVKDPVYQDDPDLLAAFNAEAQEQDKKLDAQRVQLEAQHLSLVEHAEALERQHRMLLVSLLAALVLLVLCIGAAGIVVTHKVAGPIFKMKRYLRQVSRGNLEVPWGLRRGDELVDFFDAFREMVASLRTQREQQIEAVRDLAASLETTATEEQMAKLRDFEKSLQDGL